MDLLQRKNKDHLFANDSLFQNAAGGKLKFSNIILLGFSVGTTHYTP